ncbi:MAG: c-type cytochrome [Pseudomonadota bacterium]
MRVLSALAVLAVATPAAADMISSEGLQPYEVCGLCHGLDGVSAMAKFPKLAGQKAGYIEKQLHDFRAGRRLNDGGQMQAIVTELSPEDIPVVAAWFESQSPPPVAVGEGAVEEGAAVFKARGCAGCHSVAPAPGGLLAPHLTAQHPRYLAKQLTDFRDGARENDPDGVMRTVAATLSDAEIAALAAYLAATPRAPG